MAIDRRRANEQWHPAAENGSITWERVDTALLMDIRDELQRLNALLHCANFTTMPAILRGIRRDLKAQRKRR